jgi:hypothetical protein
MHWPNIKTVVTILQHTCPGWKITSIIFFRNVVEPKLPDKLSRTCHPAPKHQTVPAQSQKQRIKDLPSKTKRPGRQAVPENVSEAEENIRQCDISEKQNNIQKMNKSMKQKIKKMNKTDRVNVNCDESGRSLAGRPPEPHRGYSFQCLPRDENAQIPLE